MFQYFALSADNYTYCYWVDDNHAAAKTTTLTTNKLNVTMDVSSLSPGMHTLFVRAKKNNGGWTSPRASHFFKMLNPATVKTYYWFDDNENSRFEIAKVNGETFMIDVAHLSDGIHTLHVRMEGNGATSTSVSNQFLKFTGNVDGYYWFDNEEERRAISNVSGQPVLIDVSHLSEGLHAFNAMIMSDGSATVPVSRTFIKMPQPTTNDTTTLKFWIDGAEYSQQKVAYGNEVVDLELDVDTLGVGMHHLQVQAITKSGSMSNIVSRYFMRMPGDENDGVMAYRYWVNDDNAESTFTAVESPMLPYQFIDDLDVEPQPFRCARFHFEVNNDMPMLYAVNDVTVQFFSVSGQLIDAKKEFIEGIAADTLTAEEWTVVRRDTVIKANTPKNETIYWYTMNLEEGDTVGIKTNYSSTLQVYSHSGKKVFESKTDSSLVMRKFIAEKDETYYLALHTVNTTKTQVTLTIDINEFMRYYNVDVTATTGGTVTGGKLYLEGTEATITATPNEGYHFVQWSDGVTETTRTFTVVSDMTLVAEFAINVYNVTLSAVNGSVTGAGEYEHGTEITISATPAEGYHFVCWSDGVTDASRSIIVTDNITLSAEFAINVYTVTLSAQNGTVTGSGNYNHGTSISISATPVAGYHFVRWSDGDTNATRTIVVTSNVTLTAEFAINVYTVAVTAVNGTIIGVGEYQHGATATLTAVPTTGYHFVRWSDGVADATRTVVVTSNVTLTAEFAINVYTVALSAQNGTVTGAGEYQHGQTANISAVPAEGYHFVKWSDGNTEATRSIVVTSNVNLTAEFAINVYTVALSAQNGTVIGAGNYNHGTVINISATPAEGYHFVRWSDGNTDATRTFTATSNITLTAEFAINVYTISATAVNGTVIGAGEYQHGQTVTLTAVANANCHFIGWSDGVMDLTRTFVATKDATFSAYFASDKYLVALSAENGTVTGAGEYEHGTTVNITATPAEGYHFVKWSDGNTEATRTIVVTSNVTLTAEFAVNVYTVAVTAVNGTIIGVGEYQHGATATLTAVPTTGYHFVRWSDGVTDITRSIVVTSNVALTAEFAINVYTVTLSAENGTVTGAGNYNHGAGVTLTATPNEGYHFVRWSDGDTNATRNITITSNVTLTAEFAINVYTVTLSAQNGIVIGAGNYNHGTTINISATPAEGYHFVRWSDGNTESTRTFTATSNITLTAEFAINVYTISATAVNGTVIGAGEYQHGQTVTLTAVANANCHFIGWSDGVMDLTRTFVATKDATFSAYFASDKYLVVLSAENGTVTGAGEYEHGTTVNISATPADGYHFVKWSDGDTNATRTIVVTSNVTLTAEFAINVYTVGVTAVNGSIIGVGEYQHGATATLTAVPTTGYHFVRWSDGVTDITRSIVVTSNVTLTAEFAINVYTVTLTAQNGTVTGAGEYQHGQTANISAVPTEGYHFVKWSDGSIEATRSIVVTSNVTLTAEFAINVYKVTLTAQNGTVTGAGEYQHGQTANISAVPADGYHFVKWSDGSIEATRSIVVTSNVTLTAEFAINVYTISATAVNGTVSGIGEYQHGATVVLTAIANTGYRFVRWSDGITDATRTFIAKENVSLTAEFTTDTYSVILTTNDIMGRVIGSGSYTYGTTITIVALPNTHYHFVKWSDGDTNDVRTIVVTENITLSAEFAANMYELELIADATKGRVVGAGTYAYGTEVTIVAIPNAGYKFSQWSDGDKNDVRTITMSGDITLTAEFVSTSIGVDVENTKESNIIAYSQNQTLYVEGIEGEYYLLDVTGKVIYYGDSHVLTLPYGVYIIATENEYLKVIIRK